MAARVTTSSTADRVDDTYIVDSSSDNYSEAAASGTDEVQSSAASTTLGANIENLTLLTGGVSGTGNELANNITGNAGANTLSGLGGNDTVDGAAGKDSLSGGSENNSLIGGADDDTLDGGTGNDTLDGGDGNDSLSGGADADTLIGGIGNDTIDGGGGIDSMTGGTGADVYVVDDAADKIAETGTDIDEVQASISYSIAGFANVENLTLPARRRPAPAMPKPISSPAIATTIRLMAAMITTRFRGRTATTP